MATRASTAAHIQRLREQATATRQVTEAHPDGPAKSLALEVVHYLESVARREEAKSTPGDVLILPSSTSEKAVMDARRQRAVQHGDNVFLPKWYESRVGLPNVLLRSSLFSAIRPGAKFVEQQLGASKQYNLWASGAQLCDYDRRVFAVCLKYHANNLPLSTCVQTTFWQFSKALKVAYTANVHQAIRKSLTRLNSVQLNIAIGGHDLPAHHLIEVKEGLNQESRPTSEEYFKGSDRIEFQVPESLAKLFGPNEWSQLGEEALHKTEGLASWLVGFYSTHAKPYSLKITELHEFSGSICPLYDFRRRLSAALKKLKSASVPDEFRISEYELKRESLLVRLASW